MGATVFQLHVPETSNRAPTIVYNGSIRATLAASHWYTRAVD